MMAPPSGSPRFAEKAEGWQLQPSVFILTSESPPLFYALGILSDRFDKRNLGLSKVAGNGCMTNPSPSLPTAHSGGMGMTGPPCLPQGSNATTSGSVSFLGHHSIPGASPGGWESGSGVKGQPLRGAWASRPCLGSLLLPT